MRTVGKVGGGVGVRDRSADRAAVAHLQVADLLGRLGQHGAPLPNEAEEAAMSAWVVVAPIHSTFPLTSNAAQAL